jgi:hypothetical protein
MSKVQIYDEIMGNGKTTKAIERMKKYIEEGVKFIYVTPFIKETERIQKAVGSSYVFTPDTKHYQVTDVLKGTENDFYIDTSFLHLNKREHFKKMVSEGRCVALTHKLFTSLDSHDYKLFKDYILILDEVIDPLEIINYGKQDIKIMNEINLISLDNNNRVTFLKENYTDNAFKSVKEMCRNSDVFFLDGYFFVWVFPIEIFNAFSSVQILTYLFNGSVLSAYFKLYEIDYNILFADDTHIKKEIKTKLNIYKGLSNRVGKNNSAFSKSWYQSRSKSQLKSMSKATTNIFERVFKTKSAENGFTSFKDYESKVKGSSFSKGFISLNCRATNDFCQKQSMSYLVNRYHTPQVINFFNQRGITLNQDLWALSEMIQWIWRGCIRNNEPMNLYIPSKRMRNLLIKWLEKEGK